MDSHSSANASRTLDKEEVLEVPPGKPFFPPVVIRKDAIETEHRIPRQWVEPSAHLGYVYSLLTGPSMDDLDAQCLFSGSGDGTIKIWRIAISESGAAMPVALVHLRTLDASTSDSIYCMTLQDGLLYAGLQCGYVAVYDLETFQRIRTLLGHQDDVLALASHRDGLYSADSRGLIKILQLRWNRC